MNEAKIKCLIFLLVLGSYLGIKSEEKKQTIFNHVRDLIAAQQYHEATSHLHTLLATQSIQNHTDFFTMGVLFTESGDLVSAFNAFKKTASLLPNHTIPLYNIAYVLKLMGNSQDSLRLYNTILSIDPDNEAAQLGRSLTYLHMGDFSNGWKAHAVNLQRQGKYAPELRELLQQDNIKDKKILLLPEGGLGDSLQFIRYAKRLHDMGAYVIVAAQNPLIPLFSLCPYINELISLPAIKPPFDAQATLMSLPAVFSDIADDFSPTIPYLQADPDLVEQWQLQMGTDRNFKIGICWQCDVHNDVSRLPIARRGIPLQQFIPLTKNKNSSWYSLQKKDGVEQIPVLSDTINLITFDNFDEEHGAFMDSAALIEALDLVITIDSAIAHLAGALGKQVWLLLPYATDWRWIQDLNYSPWYPTMTIFKQHIPFDWESVIAQVGLKLEQLIAQKVQSPMINTEVSVGEFLDKISILNIKNKKIKDQKKLKNVRTELATLYQIKNEYIPQESCLDMLEQSLFDVNSKLWDIEDKIRDKEYAQQFDDEFIQLARSVYITNDERMAIKQKLNQLCGSRLVEEKSYYNYLRK